MLKVFANSLFYTIWGSSLLDIETKENLLNTSGMKVYISQKGILREM